MKSIETYVIPFKGLKPGNHSYDFHAGGSFFKRFEQGEIQQGNVSIHLNLEKEERMMVLTFDIQGFVTVQCDRCNENFELPIHGKERLIVKPGDGFYEQDDEIQIIPETETSLDISPFLYEYIHLLLPMKRVHPDDDQGISTCNPIILQKLSELSGGSTSDPRWDELKKITFPAEFDDKSRNVNHKQI